MDNTDNQALASEIERMKIQFHLSYDSIARKLKLPKDEVIKIRYQALKRPIPGTAGMVKKAPVKFKTRKNLSYSVIKRLIESGELKDALDEETFLKLYNSKKGGGFDRWTILESPITPKDLEMLRFYLTNKTQPLPDFTKELGITPGKLYVSVRQTALKILYSHPELYQPTDTEIDSSTPVE